MVQVDYDFQLRGGEIEPLLVEVSLHYPRLCFILGTVTQARGEEESRFINNGRMQVWKLSASQREKIVAPELEIMERLESIDNPSEEEEAELLGLGDSSRRGYDASGHAPLGRRFEGAPRQDCGRHGR